LKQQAQAIAHRRNKIKTKHKHTKKIVSKEKQENEQRKMDPRILEQKT